jgi:hypothetical protein
VLHQETLLRGLIDKLAGPHPDQGTRREWPVSG